MNTFIFVLLKVLNDDEVTKLFRLFSIVEKNAFTFITSILTIFIDVCNIFSFNALI